MKFIKLLCVLLAMLFACSVLFTGCGESEESKGGSKEDIKAKNDITGTADNKTDDDESTSDSVGDEIIDSDEEEEYIAEDFAWTFEDGILTISGNGAMPDYDGYDVLDPWSEHIADITTVFIEDGVTSIGDYAFYDCSNLTSITIPDSVTSIELGAFTNCYSLTSITIPDSVTSIGDSAFIFCSNLTSITIPDSVTSIGGGAFVCCSNLTDISVADSNKNYSDVDGVLFDKSGETLLCYPAGKTGSVYAIPDSVTSIGNGAFYGCDWLKSITISDSVTSIGFEVFAHCSSLQSITIPDSVTSIGDGVFAFCESLKSITIPDSVTSIGTWAFEYCSSLTSITIPDSVTTIGVDAFSNCTALTDIYFGGTRDEWNALDPDEMGLAEGVTVHCSDGDI